MNTILEYNEWIWKYDAVLGFVFKIKLWLQTITHGEKEGEGADTYIHICVEFDTKDDGIFCWILWNFFFSIAFAHRIAICDSPKYDAMPTKRKTISGPYKVFLIKMLGDASISPNILSQRQHTMLSTMVTPPGKYLYRKTSDHIYAIVCKLPFFFSHICSNIQKERRKKTHTIQIWLGKLLVIRACAQMRTEPFLPVSEHNDNDDAYMTKVVTDIHAFYGHSSFVAPIKWRQIAHIEHV